jgi:sortase (surface protein transpeptidase)
MRIHTRQRPYAFYAKFAVIYAATLAFAWYALVPARPMPAERPVALVKQQPVAPVQQKPVISGRPVRIVIPGSGVDLPVDPGYYNQADGTWTLSGYHAQYATISTPANDSSGNTFIYGHNNNYVFGALRHNTPAVGATALLYTDNNHIFAYSFQWATSVGPDDTAILSYSGPSVMTIQTCTGSMNELRTFYRFGFTRVVQ